MKILKTTHAEIYIPIEDKIKHIITVHLQDNVVFGIGISFENNFQNLEAIFIPRNVGDLKISESSNE